MANDDKERSIFDQNSAAIDRAVKDKRVGGEPKDQQRTGYLNDKTKDHATGNKSQDGQIPGAMKDD